MNVTPIQQGNSILRPRARLIKTIGEELISNDVVALIELVKNSYDANSSIIDIRFQGKVIEIKEGKKIKKVLVKEDSSISVTDDGVGMMLDTVKTAWMEPATVNKKHTKLSPENKRRYTGEKGIGRFAAAKLASSLTMITRPENDNEIVVEFNWKDFADDSKYLDQVSCSWEVREPRLLQNHGTSLILNELNSDWDEDKLKELRVALSRLVNPVTPVTDFLINIQLPEQLIHLGGWITPPESLNKPDYAIKGHIFSNGKAEIIYQSKKTAIPEDISIEHLQLRNPVRASSAGPFSFEIRAWDRDPNSLKEIATQIGSTVKNIKNDLDDLSGISIYRDNFRVLPYGDKKNDWLRLDIRRVNNPTLRLSNNQVVGYVSISLDNNPELKDQSNREGIIESQAFTDFQDLITLVLNELEIRRYNERPRESQESKKNNLFSNFSIASVSQLIEEKLPNDPEAKKIVDATQATIQEGVKKVQDVLSRYRRLSTLGLLIDVVLHDGNNFLATLDSDLFLLSKEVSKKEPNFETIKEHTSNINEGRKVLSALFKRLEPFGGRKRGRPSNIVIEEAITNVFQLYKGELQKLNIKYKLPSTASILQIDSSDVQLIFVNLLQNSIYWLETIPENREIIVEVSSTSQEIIITFSDSGPGIRDGLAESIFDPYFSTRPDGIGLGLTIVGELTSEYDGELSLLVSGPLDGATFKMIFPKK